MTRGSVLRVALMVTIVGAPVRAQSLTDEEVAAALRTGEAGRQGQLVASCVATAGFKQNFTARVAPGGIRRSGAFSVVITTNAGRIASLAADAKRLYQHLSVESVAEEYRTRRVYVSVEPRDPSATGNVLSVASPIDRVVLQTRGRGEPTVQPTRVDTEPVEWFSVFAVGRVAGNRAVGVFEHADVGQLLPGDLEVVVITADGERRCVIDAKARARVLDGSGQ